MGKTVARFMLFAILVLLLLVLAPARDGLAHNSATLIGRNPEGQTPPVIDAECGSSEYANAWDNTLLYYGREFHLPYARIHLLADGDYLYVCINRMRYDHRDSYVWLTFDTDHDGGRTPDEDDIRLVISSSGDTTFYRGNGTVFVEDTSSTGWSADADVPLEFELKVEARFHRDLLGNPGAWDKTGFYISHRAISSVFEVYSWPPRGAGNVPGTWADAIWWGDRVRLDQARVTQGMDYDSRATVAYDRIAGKDTLIRAQLYAHGETRDVASASCVIRQIGGSTETIVPVDMTRPPRLSPGPMGYFNGTPTFDCWVNGEVFDAANYRISIRLQLEGDSVEQTVVLGSYEFKDTGNLRVFLAPTEAIDPQPWRATWDATMRAALQLAMVDLNRITALPSTVDQMTLNFDDLRRTDDGLRYLVNPVVYRCDYSDGLDPCETVLRARSTDALLRFNATAALYESITGIDLERLDTGTNVSATTATGGGQSCWAGHRVAGSAFDARLRGPAPSVAVQEMMHCLDHVPGSSPHFDGGSHTIDEYLSELPGRPLVDFLNRSDEPGLIRSVMYGRVGAIQWSFYTGWDWNFMREQTQDIVANRYGSRVTRSAAEADPLFHFVGSLNLETEIVTPYYSARLEDLEIPVTPADEDSPYSLRFLDSDNQLLTEHPFAVDSSGTHEEYLNSSTRSMVITVPLPEDAARVEVVKESRVLYESEFSQLAPVIQEIVVNAVEGGIEVAWNASDPDSQELRYNLYYRPHADGVPFLIANGLEEDVFFYDTTFTPAGDEGTIVVEATDGLNTTQAESNPFTVTDRPPLAEIVSPLEQEIVAGQRTILRAVAYDHTAASLDDEAFSWHSNIDGSLGSGAELHVTLSPGQHTLTLGVITPSNQETIKTMELDVLPDTDGDSLPDSYETEHACLSETIDEGLNDPDGDMLLPAAERLYGSDPCLPDSDDDLFGDGDEVRLGSDLMDESSVPAPLALFPQQEGLDLGLCQDSVVAPLEVQTAESSTVWSVGSDRTWFVVEGGGTGDGTVWVEAQCEHLVYGEYDGNLILTAENGEVQLVPVRVEVGGPEEESKIWIPLVVR